MAGGIVRYGAGLFYRLFDKQSRSLGIYSVNWLKETAVCVILNVEK